MQLTHCVTALVGVPLISTVLTSFLELLLTDFMSTRDTLQVARTCLYAVPLKLLEGRGGSAVSRE